MRSGSVLDDDQRSPCNAVNCLYQVVDRLKRLGILAAAAVEHWAVTVGVPFTGDLLADRTLADTRGPNDCTVVLRLQGVEQRRCQRVAGLGVRPVDSEPGVHLLQPEASPPGDLRGIGAAVGEQRGRHVDEPLTLQ